MPFFLDGNPTQSEIAEAVNYLLGNVLQSTATNIITGQVTDATGNIVSYLYKYLDVKYADSFDGTLNFSDVPTNRAYYGLRNNDSSIESTNPADYVWYQVVGGFSTTKFIWYSVTGGRRIDIVVSTSSPSIFYQIDTGIAINLDQISAADGASSRICYAKSASFALASTPTTYQTSGPSGFPPYNTWGGSETWQATPPMLGTNEALFQSDGIYNPSTDLTTWNVPYLSNLKVGTLSAISADLGTITAGDISVGSFPAISGTTMTGTGSHLYNNGRFITGNPTTNIVFDGSQVYLNGFANSTTSSSSGTPSVPTTPTTILTFTVYKQVPLIISATGQVYSIIDGPAFTPTYANYTLLFQIYDPSGTAMSANVMNSQGIVNPYGIQWTGMASPQYGFEQSYACNMVVSLPVGTYTLRISGISAYASYTGPTTANATTYQASYKTFVYQAAI